MIKFNHLLFNEIKRTILSLVIAIIFISVKPFVPPSYQLFVHLEHVHERSVTVLDNVTVTEMRI